MPQFQVKNAGKFESENMPKISGRKICPQFQVGKKCLQVQAEKIAGVLGGKKIAGKPAIASKLTGLWIADIDFGIYAIYFRLHVFLSECFEIYWNSTFNDLLQFPILQFFLKSNIKCVLSDLRFHNPGWETNYIYWPIISLLLKILKAQKLPVPAGQNRCSGPPKIAKFLAMGTLSSLSVKWAGSSWSWFVPVNATDDNRSKVTSLSGLGYSMGLHSVAGLSLAWSAATWIYKR